MLRYVPPLPRWYTEPLEWRADGRWELRLLRSPGGGTVLVAGVHGAGGAGRRLQDLGGERVSDIEEKGFNHGAFFDAVRHDLFHGHLNQDQVDGIGLLLDTGLHAGLPPEVELEQLAYILATAYHETAHTMTPLHEYGGRRKKYAPWYGRGFVQLTWEKNFAKMQEKLHRLVTATDSPFYELYEHDTWRVHDHKEDACLARPAALICVLGMRDGDFTGRSLNDYIKPNSVDYVHARRIVNGMDRAQMIAGYAKTFEHALREGTA